MSASKKVKAALSSHRGKLGRQRTAWFSEETAARLAASALWAVVGLAAVAGIAAWLRPVPSPAPAPQVADAGRQVSETWAVAGVAQRFVDAYLGVGPGTADRLTRFLGYTPDLPPGAEDAEGVAGSVWVVGVDPLGDGYWSVVVGTEHEDGEERFWQVGVTVSDDGVPVVAGMPTPVARTHKATRVSLATPLSAVPTDAELKPLVDTVEGFLASYACGEGDVDRWLAPDAELASLQPPLCQTITVDRWGATGDEDEAQATVLVEALLKAGPDTRRAAFSLHMTEREGRWEVAELLAGPPLAGRPPPVPDTADKPLREEVMR